MRKWAYLEHPISYNNERICKVMIYETKNDGTHVFLYNSPKAQICVADEWYEKAIDAEEAWNSFIQADSWFTIDDPLPDCQADCIFPIRVKGRNTGNPEWGHYEVLVDGNWIDYKE